LGARSFKVIDVGTPESSSRVLVMIRGKSVSICNHYRAKLVDCTEMARFQGVRKFDALVRRTAWTYGV